MSAGTTNAAASGGGLSIIASGTMSSPDPADVTTTLSSPAKMLIAQIIGSASSSNAVHKVACLLPGETIELSYRASVGLSGNGQVISYTAGNNYDYEHLKYIALG